MLGAMIETRLGLATAKAHLAFGSGAFSVTDLDTALLLGSDPCSGGPYARGPDYVFDNAGFGHGISLALEDLDVGQGED